MKRFILFARVCTLLTFAIPMIVHGQNNNPYPNYVVIGAFASEKNAIYWTDDANTHNYTAKFEINPNRNLFYVYILTTANRDFAFAEALRLRKETKYFDTWVYNGLLGKSALANPLHQGQDFNPATEQRFPSSEAPQNSLIAGNTDANTNPKDDGSNDPTKKKSTRKVRKNADPAITNGKVVASAEQVTGATENNPAKTTVRKSTSTTETSIPLSSEDVVGKNFFFKLFRASNNEVVEGHVDAIDFEKSRRMATYPGNKPVRVLMPPGKPKQVSFICEVFGYRKLQKEFDPNNPSEELFLDEAGNLVVPFELVRLQKGDIAIMYNVFFFKDAAVMRPESRYEVNNLLELLNENPLYKIRIHGHTNGNAAGKIIRMDKSENFYSLSNTKEGFGSSKKLSEERALVMKQFLISSGIKEDRMEIKARGGKKPLHDKHAVRANENVRVEIEILSD